MIEQRLYIVELDTNQLHGLPVTKVMSLSQETSISTVELLGPRSMLIRRADPVTGRTDKNLIWQLHFPGMTDKRSIPITSTQLISLLEGWRNIGTQLKLAGADLRNLKEERLRPEQTGSLAYKRYWGAHPWWATVSTIEVNGVKQNSGFTVDYDNGCVTFSTAQNAVARVTSSASREPRGRITDLQTSKVDYGSPIIWDITATFREDDPS